MCTLAAAVALTLSGALLLAGTAHAIDYDCSDFSTQAEAMEYLLPGDPHRLDADGDGIPCESLPAGTPSGDGGGGGGGSDTPPPPPPKPEKLKMGAAKNAAKAKARGAGRRAGTPRPSLKNCKRRSRHRIDCGFVGKRRGAAAMRRCGFRVSVRGEGARANAKLTGRSCRSRKILRLSYKDARAAMLREASRQLSAEANLASMSRLNPRRFIAEAYWESEDAGGAPTVCSARLKATLTRPNQVQVSISGERCFERGSS